MQAVNFTLNGKPASVEFISRYHDQNDYRVHLGGGTSGRVRHLDGGAMSSQSEHLTDADAAIAIAAYLEAQEREYQEWRRQNAHLLESA